MIWTLRQILKFIIKNWNKKDAIFEIKQKREKTLRSLAQNRYYFWVILEYICAFIGIWHKFEKLEMHKQIKDYFQLETTTDLDTKEFAKMCEEIRAWYLEYRDLYIPLPNEVEELASLEKYLF